MMKILVNDSNIIEVDIWNDYACEHYNGTVFHTLFAYLLFNEDPSLQSFAISVTNNSGQTIGFAQGYVQTVKEGLLASFSRRAVLMQTLLYKNRESLDYLLKALTEYIGQRTVYTEIRCSTPEIEMQDVYRDNGFIFEDHLDILVDLKPDIDSIFNQMSKTRRKQINRGYSRGVHIDIVDRNDLESIRSCYEIVANLYKKIRLPCPNWEVFKYAIMHNPKHNEPFSVCFAAKLDGLIIGTRVVLCYKKRIFDWYAGSMDEHYDKYPNDILPWEVFKWGHEHGFEVFDFGGAGKPNIPYGVRDYKLKFGGELVNYGRYKRINSPIKYGIAVRGYELLRKLQR